MQYGRTMSAWTSVEFGLYLWFETIMWSGIFVKDESHDDRFKRMADGGFSLEITKAIFYSGNAFSGRRFLMEAVIPLSRLSDQTKEFLNMAVRKVDTYSRARNAIAHRTFIYDKNRNEMQLLDGDELFRQDGITVSDLGEMETNFNALKAPVIGVFHHHWSKKGPPLMLPQEGLSQLRALPHSACAKIAR